MSFNNSMTNLTANQFEDLVNELNSAACRAMEVVIFMDILNDILPTEFLSFDNQRGNYLDKEIGATFMAAKNGANLVSDLLNHLLTDDYEPEPDDEAKEVA